MGYVVCKNLECKKHIGVASGRNLNRVLVCPYCKTLSHYNRDDLVVLKSRAGRKYHWKTKAEVKQPKSEGDFYTWGHGPIIKCQYCGHNVYERFDDGSDHEQVCIERQIIFERQAAKEGWLKFRTKPGQRDIDCPKCRYFDKRESRGYYHRTLRGYCTKRKTFLYKIYGRICPHFEKRDG